VPFQIGVSRRIRFEVQSYITDDKVYCIYIARDEQLVREHAKQADFPANRISEIRTIVDPTTAEA
jgi:hypothetical protein